MKTIFYQYLIGLVLLVLWSAGEFVMAEQPLKTDEDSPRRYRIGDDGIKMYGRLQAHGDYSKLKLIVRSNKNEYYRGEPVYIQFYVRNDSDGEVYLKDIPATFPCAFLWKVKNSQKEDVSYTLYGKKIFQSQKEYHQNEDDSYRAIEWGGESGFRYFKLQSGQEWKLHLGEVTLSEYFDLTLPDTYKLTCFQINFINDQQYDLPLQSNTVTFTMRDSPRFYSEAMRRSDVVGQFDNPEPGKEVFEQKEEPKNIFSWENPDTHKREILNVSPTTVWKQRAEKEAAKRKEAEKKE